MLRRLCGAADVLIEPFRHGEGPRPPGNRAGRRWGRGSPGRAAGGEREVGGAGPRDAVLRGSRLSVASAILSGKRAGNSSGGAGGARFVEDLCTAAAL